MKKPRKYQKTEEYKVLNNDEAFTFPLQKLAEKLEVNLETGLTQAECEKRLKKIGPNVIPKVKTNILRVYLEPLSNWLVVIYLIASMILAIIALLYLPQLWIDVSLWLPLIIINMLIIVIQTARAQTELTSLQKLSAPKSHVLRDKKFVELSSDRLVIGDVLTLEPGDLIPADSRIVKSSNLKVNEASLTGESNGVEKSLETSADLEEPTILRKKSSLFLGTFVISGSATALVVRTGRDTQIGKMASKLRTLHTPKISLRKRINNLVKNLALLILLYLGISFTYFIVVFYLKGNLFSSQLILEIAKSLIKAISMMPLNIPLLVTIIMLSGALSMSKHKVIIRNLTAIENLGRISVICADKTGTITQNKMTAKWVYIENAEKSKLYYLPGPETSSEAKIFTIDFQKNLRESLEHPREYKSPTPIETSLEIPFRRLVVSAFLNNETLNIDSENQKISPCELSTEHIRKGDPTDVALLCLFNRSNLNSKLYQQRFQVIQSWSLDTGSKIITRILKDKTTNKYYLITKGATETLLVKSNFILNDKGETQSFTQKNRNQVAEKVEIFSQYGNRVISFAFREIGNFDSKKQREHFEANLTYLGYVAINDPSREGVDSAIFELREAGIKPIMITGDSIGTTKSIAEEIGIVQNGQQVVEGSQIQNLSDQDFLNTVAFARVSPDDKSTIVTRYKKQNYVVAMTGDGVNDAQAILTADVGIAMGITGTDMAKQTADLVLADDSLNSIVTGIKEGRGVFEKIQNVIFFYIAVSVGEALVFFGSSFILGFFLMSTWQLVYIATLQFVSPFALVIDKLDENIMREKPRSNEALIGGPRRITLVVFTFSLSLVLSIAYILVFNGVLPVFDFNKTGVIPNLDLVNPINSMSWEQAKARTMLLSVVVIATSMLVLSVRRLKKPIYKSLKQDKNRNIWPFVLSVPIFHLVLMYVPVIQNALSVVGIRLELIQLTLTDWLIVLILGLLPTMLLEITKIIIQKWNERKAILG